MFPRRRTTKDSRQSSPKKRTKPAHTHKRTGRSAHNWRSWRFPAPAARCAFIQKPSSGSSALKGQRFLRPTPLALYYFCFSRRRCPSTSFSRRSYCSFSLPICYRPCRFALFSSNLVMGNSHKHSGFFLFFFFFLYIFRILSLMECCLSSACLIKRPGLLLARFIAAIRQNDETAPRDAILTLRKVSHTEPFYLLVDIYKAHKRPNDRPGRFNHHQEVRGSPTIA